MHHHVKGCIHLYLQHTMMLKAAIVWSTLRVIPLKTDRFVLLGYRIPDPVVEVLKGIRCYFDKALPVMLLYKKERKQYQEAVKDDISPSFVYGGEHLLRLFGMLDPKR